MAYMKALPARICCSEACNKPATAELCDRWNASYGAYCGRCGTKALKRLKAQEVEEDKR